MSQSENLRPNLPPTSGLDSLPNLGRPVQPRPLTKADADAADPSIPRVAPRIPTWLENQPSSTPTQPDTVQMMVPEPPPLAYPQFTTPQTSMQAAQTVPPVSYSPDPRIGSSETSTATNPFTTIPPPMQGAMPGSIAAPSQPQHHPVVNALLNDLGFSESKLHVVTVNKHRFTMRQLPMELFAHAMQITSRVSTTNDAYAMRLNLTIASLSVVAIDGTASWRLANVDTTKAGLFEELNPPFAIASKAASFLIDLFLNQLPPDIISKIADEYDRLWSTENADADLLAQAGAIKKDDKRMRFACSAEGCTHHEDIEPTYLDSKGSIKPRFCPEHGIALTPIGLLKDMADIPLD